MSYEGYEQWLCKSGHLHHFNCYDLPDEEDWKCPVCSEPLAFMSAVDTTNGMGTPRKFPIKTKAVKCKCPTCKNDHIAEPATYVIPEKI